MSNVDIFVSTIGQPYFDRCINSLKRQSYKDVTIHIIKNVEPMCEAFNRMIEKASAEYWIQVDEDFILYPHAVETLVDNISKQPGHIMCVCADLYDTSRKKNIQGVKIYRTKLMLQFRYRNIVDCEMEIIRQAEVKGYKTILIKDVVGEHAPGYNNKGIFNQYRSQYEKQRMGFNVLTDDLYRLLNEWKYCGGDKNLFALCGAFAGILMPRELLGYERNKAYYDDGVYVKMQEYFDKIDKIDVINYEEQPTISVIMPLSKVRIDYLKSAVDSIINQTFRDWEFIIAYYNVDNAIMEYINELSKTYPRVKLILVKTPGVRDALNEAVKASKGIWIARMDSDDLSDTNRFATQLAFLRANSEYSFCGTSAVVIDQEGGEINFCRNDNDFNVIKTKLKTNNTFTHGSIMINGDLLRKELYSTSPMAKYAEDYELWLRLVFQKGYKGTNILLPLYSWRMRYGEKLKDLALKEAECIRMMHNYYKDYFNINHESLNITLSENILNNETLNLEDMSRYEKEIAIIENIRKTCDREKITYNIDGMDNIHKEKPRFWEYAKGMHLTPYAHRVLDAGSGFSIFPLALAKQGRDVSSIDLSFQDLRVYQAAKLHLPIQNWIAKFNSLPFPDNNFDAVYCISCLEHIKELNELYDSIKEFKRVLKRGGLLYITTDYHKNYYDYGTAGWQYSESTRYFNNEMIKKHMIDSSGLTLIGNSDIKDHTDWKNGSAPLYGRYTFASILLKKE